MQQPYGERVWGQQGTPEGQGGRGQVEWFTRWMRGREPLGQGHHLASCGVITPAAVWQVGHG